MINGELIRQKGWNRTDISGENESRLELRNVTIAHRGPFECHIQGRKAEKWREERAGPANGGRRMD